MDESRTDDNRVVLAAALILAAVSVVMYFVVFLTLVQYQMLNATGHAFAILALVISAIAMLLACFLTLVGRTRALATTGWSGAGWIFICAGLVVGAPALGLEMSGTGSAGGVPAALFLIIAGAAILQAERNLRQADGDKTTAH